MKWVIRIVGGIAGLLLLCVVVLLARGHRANANRVHASVEVNTTPDRVWPWIDDGDKMKQWVSWTVEVRPDGPQQTGVGARRISVMRDENNGGQLMSILGTITEYTPPSRLRYRLTSQGAFQGDETFELTNLGSGRTRLDVTMTYTFASSFARILEPLITPAAEKKLGGDMARLKSLVESGT